MRTLNVLRAVLLLVGCLVLATAVHATHYYQVKRNANVFLDAANDAEAAAKKATEAGNLPERGKQYGAAMRNLGWYLDLIQGSAGEADALERLALMIADTAPNPRAAAGAIPRFEQLLRIDPTRSNVKRRLAKTLMSIRQWSDAKSLLEQLLSESPDDASLYDLRGWCETLQGHDNEAVKDFEEAVKRAPDQLEAYAAMADILRRNLNQSKEADDWMKRLEAKNPKSYKACVLHGRYLMNYLMETGKLDEAAAAVKKALKLAPDDRDALLLGARFELAAMHSEEIRKHVELTAKHSEEAKKHAALAAQHYEQARKHAERSVKLHKSDWETHWTLAQIELLHSSNLEKVLEILRAGAEATKRDPRLICVLANMCVEARKIPEARAMLDELQKARLLPAGMLGLPRAVLLRYLEARILFANEDWVKARAALEEVRPQMTDNPGLQKQVDFCLGLCYRHEGATDQELAAYRRAMEIDPLYAPAHGGAAEVYLGQGKINQAIAEYRQVVESEHAANVTWIELARMLVLKNLRLPEENRDWEEVSQVLRRALELNPASPQVPLLEAEVLVAQKRIPEAERLLERLRDKQPKQLEFWIVLASLAERQEEWDKAEKLLNDAKRQLGDKVGLRVARAQHLVRRLGPEAKGQVRDLAENTDKLSAGERLQLWGNLIGWSLQAGDDAQARRLADLVAKKDPGNLHNHFLRFELALRAQDSARLEGILADIETITGKSPMWLYGEAVRISLTAKGKDAASTKALNDALKLLAQARAGRQAWSRLALLEAGIYDQLGKPAPALERYEEAIREGERNPEAVRRAVEILTSRRKFAEADKLLRTMDERQLPLNPELEKRGIELSLQQHDFGRAEALLSKAKSNSKGFDAKNWRDQLWLAEVQAILGRRAKREGRNGEADASFAEAEKAFRRALALNDKAVEIWISFVQFFASVDQIAKAKDVVREASGKIPAKDAPAALAQCYEVLRDWEQAQKKTDEAAEDNEKAQKEYAAALAAAPDDPQIVRRVADFHLRSRQLAAAEPLLKQLVAGKGNPAADDVIWARRHLAMALASTGGYANLQAALKMIDENLAAREAAAQDPQDLRLRASFLAIDPSPTRRLQAIDAMESLLQREELTSPDDRFELAKLYLALGNMPKFREHMRTLLGKGGPDKARSAFYALHYIEAELAHNETDEAELWLKKLEGQLPEQFVLVGFRADILIRRGQTDSALMLLDKFVGETNVPLPVLRQRQWQTAALLEQFAFRPNVVKKRAEFVRCLQKAETLIRAGTADTPGREMALASFLARCGNVQEALAVIAEKWPNCNAMSVAQGVQSVIRVRGGKFTSRHAQEAEKILQAALKKFERNPSLLLVLAELYKSQNRPADAEQAYREILVKQPHHGTALNNLAYLLATQKLKLDEAEALITRGIAYSGAMASMLDTRAVVHLCADKPDRALADLNEAMNEGKTAAFLFHQAWAYAALGRTVDARESLAAAERAGLRESSLDPFERTIYLKLRDELK